MSNIFLNEYLKRIQKDNTNEFDLAALYTPAMLIMTAMQFAGGYLTKQDRACSGLNGPDKNICVLNFKINASKRFISALNSQKAKCSKSSDVNSCVEKINGKIQTEMDKVKSYSEQLKSLRTQVES